MGSTSRHLTSQRRDFASLRTRITFMCSPSQPSTFYTNYYPSQIPTKAPLFVFRPQQNTSPPTAMDPVAVDPVPRYDALPSRLPLSGAMGYYEPTFVWYSRYPLHTARTPPGEVRPPIKWTINDEIAARRRARGHPQEIRRLDEPYLREKSIQPATMACRTSHAVPIPFPESNGCNNPIPTNPPGVPDSSGGIPRVSEESLYAPGSNNGPSVYSGGCMTLVGRYVDRSRVEPRPVPSQDSPTKPKKHSVLLKSERVCGMNVIKKSRASTPARVRNPIRLQVYRREYPEETDSSVSIDGIPPNRDAFEGPRIFPEGKSPWLDPNGIDLI